MKFTVKPKVDRKIVAYTDAHGGTLYIPLRGRGCLALYPAGPRALEGSANQYGDRERNIPIYEGDVTITL